jgi:hypothetical protein
MTIPVFENELVNCYLDDSLPVLVHRWKREPSGFEFKSNLMRILEQYQELKKSYNHLAWLVDAAKLGELDEEIEQWLEEEWESLLFVTAGVKVHAVILGQSIYADYPMEKFKQNAERKFENYHVHLGVFSNEMEAYNWIKQH